MLYKDIPFLSKGGTLTTLLLSEYYNFQFDRLDRDRQISTEEWTSSFGLIFKEINGKDHILLTNHTKRGWQIPGGHIEKGESRYTCAKRELKEETGLCVNKTLRLVAVCTLYNPNGDPNGRYPIPYSHMAFYGARITNARFDRITAPLTEILGAEFIPVDEVFVRASLPAWEEEIIKAASGLPDYKFL